ncbi:MAG: HD domain-containing protein [Clostridia bacterium]|nr:HD domain-containing protein [Clostridia bacterium]
MRRKSINSVKGNEILAKDVYGTTDTILMVSGMTLKKEYIEKLKQLNVDYVYVEDSYPGQGTTQETIEQRIKMHCQKTIENIYERYSYCGDVELKELTSVAYQVILEVLKEPNVLFSIENIRQEHETVYTHSLNVCALAVLVALKMKLDKTQIEDIAIGSLIHDIGYLYLEVPGILENFSHSLEAKNKSLIKKHVVFGYTEVENEIWLSKKAKNIILSHHEYYDGSGYPLRLNKDDIDIETKVVTVCNDFERLVNGSSNGISKSHEAVEFIISQAARRYDPEVVDAFSSSVARYPNGTSIVTNEGEIGIVIGQNIDFPTRPIIRILYDSCGKKLDVPVEKNLVKELTLFIEEIAE